MSAWEDVPLGELLESGRGISYGIVQPGEGRLDGVPIVRVNAVKGGRIDTGDPLRVAPEVEAQYGRTRLRGGELVVTLVGTVGEAAEVPPQLSGWNVARAIGVIPVRGNVGARWVRYVLGTERVQHLIDSWCNTTVQKTLNLKDVARIPIALPPQAVRQAISHVLGALDDKIELNSRMNETLEAMARALFKAWFVDFDPAHTDADQMIAAGVLEIGDGYRAKNSELGPPGLPFIRAGDLNSGFDTDGADVLNEANVPKARNKVSRPGDVAFTSKGTVGRFARVTRHTQPFVYSPQVCFWRSLDKRRLDPAILYCWMQDDDFRRQVSAVAGQTDMAPYVSLRDQRRMKVPVFPVSQHATADQIRPLFEHQAVLAAEAKTLASLRDLLLPKLLSGELRVREADGIVERAV